MVRPKDVAVIGAGLGGLSAAIHLRLAGHRVSIFEQDARVGGRANLICDQGFRFDTGPSLLNYPWVFEDLFRAAGRNLYDHVSLIPVDPSVTFRWRNGESLQLSSDRETLVREFERFEPDAAKSVDRFFLDAEKKYRLAFDKLACRNVDGVGQWMGALSLKEAAHTGVWRSLYGELSRFFTSRYIREALGSYAMYLGASPFRLAGLFSILPYGEIAQGLWLPKGGIYALVQAIETLARNIGVEIHTNARVVGIERRMGRVIGVNLGVNLAGHHHPADIVVSNLDHPSTQVELLGAAPPKVAMTPGVVTFYWGVRSRPAGLGHHTIFLPDDYRGAFDDLLHRGKIPTDIPFYVSVPSESDPSMAPTGDSSVFVLVPVPVLSQLGDVDWPGTVAYLRNQVLDRLKRHGVYLEDSIVFERCWTPVDWRDKFGLFDGSAFGAAHQLSQLGPFRAPNWSREIAGLFYTGSSTTPGAGMPMVVLGGKMTAERIAAHVR